ncbi:MAG: peptidoglycan-binding protein LysM [Gemmatimonadota bacterium]|nr:peptidoglycan-binding protein LysM [Gemmatimonadota bacterium]
MGVFDFVKDAGQKLGFGKGDKEAQETERAQEAVMGGKLRRHLQGLGIAIEKVNVTFDDGVATVTGKAASQAEKEKAILALGNTQGVSRVVDEMTVGVPEPEGKFYTVVKGDSLSKIAKAQYGDAMKYPVIFEANKPMLTDPNKIYPGQVLRIPPLK